MDGERLEQVPGVTQHDLDGQLLLLRAGAVDVLHLDAVASDVWRALAAAPTPAELAASLAAAYDVPAEVVAQDLGPVLAVLREHGLVTAAPC
jgi:hypothetical protein